MARKKTINQTLSNEALGLYVDDRLALDNVWEGSSPQARVIGFFDDGRPVVALDNNDGSNYGSDDWETYKDGINADYLDTYDIEYDIEQGNTRLWALSANPEDHQFKRAEVFGLGLGDEIELGRTKTGALIITNKEWDTTGRYPPVKAKVIGFKTNSQGKITSPLLGIDRQATKIRPSSAKWNNSKEMDIAWRYQSEWGENATTEIHQDQGFAYITAKTVFKRLSTNQPKTETYQATSNKEHKQMSNTRPAFLDMVKTDASNAGYRIAAHQLTKGTKTAIATLLAKQGGSSNGVKAIEEMLDTEYGQAAIAMALGLGIHYAPVGAMKDPRVQRIADELRINSMSSAGNQIMNELMELLMPVLTSAIAAIPSETNARIATTPSAQEEEEHVEKAYKIKAA